MDSAKGNLCFIFIYLNRSNNIALINKFRPWRTSVPATVENKCGCDCGELVWLRLWRTGVVATVEN